jgi:DNA transformation protein
MPPGQEFAEHARDLLTRVGPPFDEGTRLRRMFGGHGIFCDGVMFALIADETLYLKVDDETRQAFFDTGSEPFVYERKGKDVELSYVTVPDTAAEDIDDLRPWAHMTLTAANRAHAKKKPRKP